MIIIYVLIMAVVSLVVLMLCSGSQSAGRKPATGNGTVSNPYRITCFEELCWISQNKEEWDKHFVQTKDIDASVTKEWKDENGEGGWKPIGNVKTPFTGSYNGKGFKIDGLYINRPSSDKENRIDLGSSHATISSPHYIGLFGIVKDSEVKNLDITNTDIRCGTSGSISVGGLVGDASNSEIVKCNSDGSVTGKKVVGGLMGAANNCNIVSCSSKSNVKGTDTVGGLVGSVTNHSKISHSHSEGNVKTIEFSVIAFGGLVGCIEKSEINNCNSDTSVDVTGSSVGGLVGTATDDSKIMNSCSRGSVKGTVFVGGLVGEVRKSTIDNSYSTGKVKGKVKVGGLMGWAENKTSIINSYSKGDVTGDRVVGGLVGEVYLYCKISNSYSVGKVIGNKHANGLVGNVGFIGEIERNTDSGTIISNSFWDTDTLGQSKKSETDGGKGLTTEQMRNKSTFIDVGWDFEKIWDIDISTNNGYPFLKEIEPEK